MRCNMQFYLRMQTEGEQGKHEQELATSAVRTERDLLIIDIFSFLDVYDDSILALMYIQEKMRERLRFSYWLESQHWFSALIKVIP